MKLFSRLMGGIFIVLVSSIAFAQGACYPGQVYTDSGRPANSATVSVCNAGGTFPGCTSTTSLFTTPALSVAASNPVTTDAHGNFGFCAAAGANYDLQITGTGITPLTIKNLPLPPTSPIVAASLTSSSASPANVGVVKLATGDCLDWRNFSNSGNIQLCKTGAAAGNVPADTFDMTANFARSQAFIDNSANPAATGFIRAGNNTPIVEARNAANSADLNLLQADASNNAQITPPIRQVEQAAPSGIASSDLLWADSTNHCLSVINNNGSSSCLVTRSATETLTGKTLGGTTPFNRLRANQGSALVAGDFALSGWGTTASVGSILGTDAAFSFAVTSAGTGQAVGPTVTLTFHDGTWTSSPICNPVPGPGNNILAAWLIQSVSATQLVIQATLISANFTPAAGNIVGATITCEGRP